MKTDRELLEFAAKSVGYSPWGSDCEGHPIFVVDGHPMGWNPLADDGDALRLVVKLKLELSVFRDHVTAFHATGWCDELNAGDAQPATRRAIVRAAAAIGENS